MSIQCDNRSFQCVVRHNGQQPMPGALFISGMSLLIIWVIYILLAFVLPDNPLELNSIILNAMTSVLFRYFNIYEIL